jgi:hypothetical protein
MAGGSDVMIRADDVGAILNVTKRKLERLTRNLCIARLRVREDVTAAVVSLLFDDAVVGGTDVGDDHARRAIIGASG